LSLSSTDRLDILELLAKADIAATRRDSEAYVALFTNDAALEGNKGDYHGKEALRQTVMPVWKSEGPASVHLTLNSVVSPVAESSDEAIATSTLVILSLGPPISIYNVSNIVQHVTKEGNVWLIRRRSVQNPGKP
jgi:hypothetical protein